MTDDSRVHFDEWERRAAGIGPAIRLAFPTTLMDQDCLRTAIKNAARPLTPRGGFFTKIYCRIFPSAWVDTELLDFLKLLRDHDWTQIDWNLNWMVIPILSEPVLAYCLPGILSWIVMDANAALEAIEGLLDYSLARIFLEQRATDRKPRLFNAEQKHVISEVVRLLRDLSVTGNPEMQKAAADIIIHLSDERDWE